MALSSQDCKRRVSEEMKIERQNKEI